MKITINEMRTNWDTNPVERINRKNDFTKTLSSNHISILRRKIWTLDYISARALIR